MGAGKATPHEGGIIVDLEVFASFKQAREAGDEKKALRLRNKLVTDNMPLVYKLVARLKRNSAVCADLPDLVQHGAIGLMKALDRFDPTIAKFSTYAAHWVRHEVQEGLRLTPRIKKPHNWGMPWKKRQEADRIQAARGRPATADELGVSEAEREDWRTAEQGEDFVPLHAQTTMAGGIVTHDHERKGYPLEERLCDPEATAENQMIAGEDEDQMRLAITKLRPREQRVVQVMYFQDGGRRKDLAQELGVSIEMVRQIQLSAVAKLRKIMGIDPEEWADIEVISSVSPSKLPPASRVA